MLPFCYERMRTSGEATLNSLESAKRLFEVFCEKLPKQYVIIDGLDECVREEINTLLTFMDRVVGRYDSVEPGRLRLLIVSQHLTDIQKRLSNPEVLDIQPAHTASDIRNFVKHQLAGVSETFDIDICDVDEIVQKTCMRAAGR
jgi:hypothetical protein